MMNTLIDRIVRHLFCFFEIVSMIAQVSLMKLN